MHSGIPDCVRHAQHSRVARTLPRCAEHEQHKPTHMTHTNAWHTYKGLFGKHMYYRDVMGKTHTFCNGQLLVLEIVDKKCHFSVKWGTFGLLRCAPIKSNMYTRAQV